MSDLTFFVEFAGSIAVIAAPVVVIARLLAADGGAGITDLFMVPRPEDLGPPPLEEASPARWRVERLTPRRRATPSSGDDAPPRTPIPAVRPMRADDRTPRTPARAA